MPKCGCNTSKIQCSFGTSGEKPINILPLTFTKTEKKDLGVTMNFVPFMNIPNFGNCTSPANPMVIAALGVPQPCIPVPVMPWAPGSKKVKVTKMPELTDDSKTMCAWAGVIQMTKSAENSVNTK
jgi:hypothetical protein